MNLPTELWQSFILFQYLEPLYDVIEKTCNPELIQGVNIQVIDALKTNATKCSLLFDDSCGKICNSKAIVDKANGGKERGLRTFYFEHKLFHQSKLGRDVELESTHIVFSKPPRDKMRVGTFDALLGLGSKLIGC